MGTCYPFGGLPCHDLLVLTLPANFSTSCRENGVTEEGEEGDPISYGGGGGDGDIAKALKPGLFIEF